MKDPAVTGRVGANYPASLLIGGQTEGGQGLTFEVENPATGEIIARLNEASADQVERSVMAARDAFASGIWSDPQLRRKCLDRLATLMAERLDYLAHIAIDEIGTPISLARALQIGAPTELLRFFAGAATKDRTEHLGRHNGPPASESIVYQRPVGVVAAITAFNYPILLAIAKAGAALAAGCTVVLLPSPRAPLSTLALVELIKHAGFPPGVINIVLGGAEAGEQLCRHRLVDKVSFTGSVEIGRKIMEQAAAGPRDVVLELGGKSAAIILPDENFDTICPALHARYARNAGQGCGSPTRILVPHERLDEFVAASVRAYADIKVGDPRDPETAVGPLISREQRDRVETAIAAALADGATIAAGGGRPEITQGWYMNPTLLSGLSNQARIAREELFAPVAVLIGYDDIEDAVRIANDSEYGLVCYLYGPAEQCHDIARQVQVGTVAINGGGGMRVEAPLGGFRQSGFGREWGEPGIAEFLASQHVQEMIPMKTQTEGEA